MDRISALLRYSLWAVTNRDSDDPSAGALSPAASGGWRKAPFTLPRGLDIATWRVLERRRQEDDPPGEPLS